MREWEVTLNNKVHLIYREWSDPDNGLVLNFSLVDTDGNDVTDDQLIDIIQMEVEESLI